MMQNQIQNNANTDQAANRRAFNRLTQLTPGVAGAGSDPAKRAEPKSQQAAAAPAPACLPLSQPAPPRVRDVEGERKDARKVEDSHVLAQTVEVQAAEAAVEQDKKLDSDKRSKRSRGFDS